MGLTLTRRLAGDRRLPSTGRWSLAALLLASAGVGASTALVLAVDSEPGDVLWPLVVAPIAIALLPVLLPRRDVRVAAAVALGAWCVLAGFSIGLLLLPALVAQVGAAIRDGP